MSLSCVVLCFIFITHCVLKTNLFYGHSESQNANSPAWLNCVQVLVNFECLFEILGQWDVTHKLLTASLNGTLPVLVTAFNGTLPVLVTAFKWHPACPCNCI